MTSCPYMALQMVWMSKRKKTSRVMMMRIDARGANPEGVNYTSVLNATNVAMWIALLPKNLPYYTIGV